MNFSCQHCNRICDWDSREPLSVVDDVEVKTIGERYCNTDQCIEAEARVHRLPIERVRAWHQRVTP